MSDYRELVRLKLLGELYEKMTPKERQEFAQLTMDDDRHKEIMDALNRQHEQINHVVQKVEQQSWSTNFLSDVSANVLTNSLWEIGRWIFGRR